jgi:hypothetical protein
MLVIAVDTGSISPERLAWTARRHDDDGPESTGVATAQGLFDAVFSALHDGEQVAIGFNCPLTRPVTDTADSHPEAALARAVAVDGGPGVAALRALVDELGHWRPWTIVTTSLPRWKATTSVLLWEAAGDEAVGEPAIDAFYAMLRGPGNVPSGSGEPVLNLAAAAAVASEASADPGELTRPVLRIRVGSPIAAAQ